MGMSENFALNFLKALVPGRKKPTRDPKYATFNRRMIAATLDSFIVLLFAPVFDWISPINRSTLPQTMPDPMNEQARADWAKAIVTNHEFMGSLAANWAWQLFGLLAFSAVCWHFWSATPGKMLLRIKIADSETEAPITHRQIIIRIGGYLISGFCFMLGFCWIGIDKKRRAWHDLMAHTVVIKEPWRKKKEGAPSENSHH